MSDCGYDDDVEIRASEAIIDVNSLLHARKFETIWFGIRNVAVERVNAPSDVFVLFYCSPLLPPTTAPPLQVHHASSTSCVHFSSLLALRLDKPFT
eukprot:350991-Hanusia_phi.AAC.1